MTGRERILAMLDQKPVDKLPLMPITMQFACKRTSATYRQYCTDYRVLVEGQLRTVEEFAFDYVNSMSDPAREAADCGAVVRYYDDHPVAIVEAEALLKDKTRLAGLKIPDPFGGGRMHNAIKAIESYKQKLNGEKLIEGWVEGPCAEGADLRGINQIMLDFYDDPQFIRDLFEFVLEMELRFAQAQIEAGADMIGIGDAAASLVGPDFYNEFIWPYEKRLVDGIKGLGARTRLHICGNTRHLMEGIAELGCDIVDLDSMVPVDEARQTTGPRQVLIGNLNPVAVVRNSNPERVYAEVAKCHQEAGGAYIVGAGCEIPPDTRAENVEALGEYARCAAP
jgi:MtaA/CmuA family methyltransferase